MTTDPTRQTPFSAQSIPAETTLAAYGDLRTDARCYRPLDRVTVEVVGRGTGDRNGRIKVCDPLQRPYFESELTLENNIGRIEFLAAGPAGTHYLYLYWPGEEKHGRYVNFRLQPQTCIVSGDPDFDEIVPRTSEAMPLGRRDYMTPAGRFVGYISADTWHFDGIWLRDWIYGLPGYRHWECEMTCGLDRFLERQEDNGMVPDGIERDGRTWRVGLESDVEYILVLGVWQTWQATGLHDWMAAALPKLERALEYIMSDPRHWDETHRLIKRQHSCDTWDFDIDGASDQGDTRHVIATCDQSGYYLAFVAMQRMHAHLGHEEDARRWGKAAAEYRERANALLWDGDKYRHHQHLDEIDHGDFDEEDQLAMGNTWAMTRGLADEEQMRRIVEQYRLRQARTGDRHPWWSLQPGYPDRLHYFDRRPYCRQGGYANGGLMPWVGGELCRAAFLCGRERYGVALLRDYAGHLRRTGGAHVWYWPDGTPGFRTTNEVPYAGWGMAEWLHAALAGLGGVSDTGCLLQRPVIAPRWAAAGIAAAGVCVHYAASDAYCAYELRIDARRHAIDFRCTGSGERADVRLLLPPDWEPLKVAGPAGDVDFRLTRIDNSRYLCFDAPLRNAAAWHVACRGTTQQG